MADIYDVVTFILLYMYSYHLSNFILLWRKNMTWNAVDSRTRQYTRLWSVTVQLKSDSYWFCIIVLNRNLFNVYIITKCFYLQYSVIMLSWLSMQALKNITLLALDDMRWIRMLKYDWHVWCDFKYGFTTNFAVSKKN